MYINSSIRYTKTRSIIAYNIPKDPSTIGYELLQKKYKFS